jgi:two-component system, cell cycle response regulator
MSLTKMPALPKKNGRLTSLLDGSTLKSSGLFCDSSYMIPTLTFLSGEALGKELPLVQQQVKLGRGPECDVVIMDSSISREHVQLSCRRIFEKDSVQRVRVVLRDLGSTNGTLVNYRRVRRAVLKPGDKISLGRVILKYEQRDLADQNFYNEIYRLATVDSLTSLLNKGAILRVLTDELNKRRRYRSPLSLLMMDLDDFKSLNDTYGHLTGDLTLQALARILQRNLRRQDKAGRFGGEELLLILPETGVKGAASLGERIRKDVEKSLRAELKIERNITVSLGVASYPMDGLDEENLLEHADSALYRAKALGKNRMELWKETQTLHQEM